MVNMTLSHQSGTGPCPPDRGRLQTKFKDFDLQHVYDLAKIHACSTQARNFVVEFGLSSCRIAWNLDKQDFITLLGEKQAPGEPEIVRWMSVTPPPPSS